jgi:hypothetical protein
MKKQMLKTKKKEDFILFKEVVDMVKNGEHLNPEGLQKFVNIRASINLGLSYKLKEAFPETVPVKRPRVNFLILYILTGPLLLAFKGKSSRFCFWRWLLHSSCKKIFCK